MRGESVGAPVQGWLLLRQDSEPEKQKTDDSMGMCVRGGEGVLCSFCSLSVFTPEGCQEDTAAILCLILAVLWHSVVPLLCYQSNQTHGV